jgi:hypothetical protein
MLDKTQPTRAPEIPKQQINSQNIHTAQNSKEFQKNKLFILCIQHSK